MRRLVLLVILFLLITSSALASSMQSISSDESPEDTDNSSFKSYPILNYLYRFCNFFDRNNFVKQKKVDDNFVFLTEDVELKDDAFHGSNYLHFTEWWYFDAILDNGYSVQVGIRVLSLINQGLVHLRLDIYKDGELISNELKSFLIWDFFTSEEVPLVELNRNRIMNGYIDKETGDWIYNLDIEFEKTKAELIFIGCTKGWKGSTPGGEWAVLLPRAEVKGTITINNNSINVSGIGYHDHNWDITLFTGINFGWYWGKVNSDNFTATWSKIMTTRFWGQPLLVINEKNGEYININQENINLRIDEIAIFQGMLIPYSFALDASEENISIHVDMEVFDIHHIRWFGIINYWRYHIRCRGYIIFESKTELIDQVEIAEFIRFR